MIPPSYVNCRKILEQETYIHHENVIWIVAKNKRPFVCENINFIMFICQLFSAHNAVDVTLIKFGGWWSKNIEWLKQAYGAKHFPLRLVLWYYTVFYRDKLIFKFELILCFMRCRARCRRRLHPVITVPFSGAEIYSLYRGTIFQMLTYLAPKTHPTNAIWTIQILLWVSVISIITMYALFWCQESHPPEWIFLLSSVWCGA